MGAAGELDTTPRAGSPEATHQHRAATNRYGGDGSLRVLFTRPYFASGLSWSAYQPLLPDWELTSCHPADLPDNLDGVDVVCPVGARVDADLIGRGSFGLIQQLGVGLDAIDVPAATEAGVWVARLPADRTGNAASVGEQAVLLLLAVLRQLDQSRAALRSGSWGSPAGRSLVDRQVVILGLGSVGTAVAQRLVGFGCRIIGVRAHPERGGPEGVDRVVGHQDLPGLLPDADALICCALYEAGMPPLVDRAVLDGLTPGAILVNVARGGLVDEGAVLDALEDGRLAGVGLDVVATEPPDLGHPLLAHPRAVITPHVAGVTDNTFHTAGRLFAREVTRWASGQRPTFAVNTPAHPRGRCHG
ncbi:MAG TPA: NAD(P)-dependent oxidoreductase [Acidimicrobiales bacterium]|jgi:phosphoglycerate dehydrogenase-like enzyme|nr:NAD(P)-dependent oxidoreductase [Acidimicrobiales bacterium]